MTPVLVFAWGLGLFPLAFLLWYVRRDEVRERLSGPAGASRVARATRRAWMLTLGGVALLAPVSAGAFGPPAEHVSLLGGIGFGLFHFVWWFACAPLLNSAEAPQRIDVMGTPAPEGPVRTASLHVRDEPDYLPRWWWVAPIAIFVGGTAWTAWQLYAARPLSSGMWIIGITMPLAGLSFLVGYGWWARRTATGAQDVSGAADPVAYEEALDGFRRFMARGIFLMMTAGVALFVGAGAAVVTLHGDPEAQGMLGAWIGGGGGSLFGILGGVFGTVCSLRRMRLERLRRGDAGAPSETAAA